MAWDVEKLEAQWVSLSKLGPYQFPPYLIKMYKNLTNSEISCKPYLVYEMSDMNFRIVKIIKEMDYRNCVCNDMHLSVPDNGQMHSNIVTSCHSIGKLTKQACLPAYSQSTFSEPLFQRPRSHWDESLLSQQNGQLFKPSDKENVFMYCICVDAKLLQLAIR